MKNTSNCRVKRNSEEAKENHRNGKRKITKESKSENQSAYLKNDHQ